VVDSKRRPLAMPTAKLPHHTRQPPQQVFQEAWCPCRSRTPSMRPGKRRPALAARLGRLPLPDRLQPRDWLGARQLLAAGRAAIERRPAAVAVAQAPFGESSQTVGDHVAVTANLEDV